ncbi:MAG TPA: hypothetical protein VFT89_10345, partial [Rhizobiaceae bacterium]|nr:hypothetical protein [Rhizobiaceae bacterium]
MFPQVISTVTQLDGALGPKSEMMAAKSKANCTAIRNHDLGPEQANSSAITFSYCQHAWPRLSAINRKTTAGAAEP